MLPAENFKDRSVSIIGLGYVGLTLATVMADIGFIVTGVEIRDDVLEKLGKGQAHFHEQGIAEKLRRVIQSGNLTFKKHVDQNTTSTVYIITVGTPLGPDGKPRLDMVTNVSNELSTFLKDGDLVIMRSTVMLGTTRKVVRPILQRNGAKVDLAFCPERTLEGKALAELRELPQIIGGMTFNASVRASQIFQMITPTVVRVNDPETAEMIKLVDNTQRDVAFGYVNEVARICDAVGVSAAQVISAGKLGYPRTNLPMPGPVGGPCLEKDPYILNESISSLGLKPEIILAARQVNERQPEEIASYLSKTVKQITNFPATPIITLMGLAFKGRPATDDLRGTMARPILAALRRHFPKAIFRGYDAVVDSASIKSFELDPCIKIEDAFKNTHLALILNNHALFSSMPFEDLITTMARPALVYDLWNHFTSTDIRLPSGVGYAALGSHGTARLPEIIA